MTGIPSVTSPVSRLVGMEVIERLFPTLWNRPIVAAPRIIAIVNVAVKAATSMKPWSSSNEQTAIEPVGSIVAIRRTTVGSVIEVTVGTIRGDSDVDANLSRCIGNGGGQAYSRYC
jgi:hypothetical protein